jgi:hypothetical protein
MDLNIFPEAPQCGNFGTKTVHYEKIAALKIATLSIDLVVIMTSSRVDAMVSMHRL